MIGRRLLITIFGVLQIGLLAGQNLAEKDFDRFTIADGMSHNSITGIAQDSVGYLWIATPSGLNRYNGTRFVQYHSNSERNSLAAEELTGMSWLNKELLAVNTVGLHIIQTKTGETRNLYIPYRDTTLQYKFNMIERAAGDESGNIYVLSRSGFYHFDKDYKLLYRFDYYTDDKVLTEHFFFGRDLLILDKNRFLIVSINGLYIYDKQKRLLSKMTAQDCPPMAEFLDYPGKFNTLYHFLQPSPGKFFVLKLQSDTMVYVNVAEKKKTVSLFPVDSLRSEFHFRTRILPFNDSTYYLTGQFSGIFEMKFSPASGKAALSAQKLLPSYVCNAILKDKDENLWIATSKGLLRQHSEKNLVQFGELDAKVLDSFPNLRLDDIYVTGDKVYAASRGYAGLFLFDKQHLALRKQVLFDKYNSKGLSVMAIAEADENNLMLGTNAPILLFNHRTGEHKAISPSSWGPGDWTSDLYRDREGNIWVSAFKMHRYNYQAKSYKAIPNHPRFTSIPFMTEQDNSGYIWMAGHGLARYNLKADSFDLFLDSFPYIKMPDKQVNAMLIDRHDNVWFNSNNNGLIRYDARTKDFKQFTRADGLPDENIASMILIGDKIWMATYSGICCIDLQTHKIIRFGKEDGFPEMQIIKGARFCYDSTARQLYIGFASAVARFNPYALLHKKESPEIFIENIVLNGKHSVFLPHSSVTTAYNDNDLIITIGSINFSDSYAQRFAFRILKNEHSVWQQLGTQTEFNISNLSPGTYRIQVKSFSPHNRWPEQVKELTVIVTPPFWQRTWFLILLGLLAILSMYFYVRWRTNLARRKEMEKTNVEKLKADNYKSQFELEQISNYFSSSLADKKNVDDVLWDVTNNLISRLEYVDCMIYLWNEDKTRMVQKAAYGPKGKPEFIASDVFEAEPGQGVVGHVIETQQPILIEDTRTDARYRMDEEFRLSEICVPIIHDGELLGIIDSEHYEPGYFKERDIKILTTIATLIGNKIKQIESEKSLEATHKELTSINQELAEAQLSALQAQMNPHFVFNALNSIKRMILEEDNEKASRYLSKFALMIRMTLDHSRDKFVTLDENIKYLKTYLEMEQLRFDDSFRFTIETEDNIDSTEVPIPSMMIQPLVENAIWHGLMPSEANKKIRIAFTQEENQITCTIEDNGIGIRESEKLKKIHRPLHRSSGLENLQKRIHIMNEKYDTDCTLQIYDLKEKRRNDSGTLVILRLNIINV